MRNLSLKKNLGGILLIAFCFALFSVSAYAQTVLAQQGFETPPAPPVWSYTNTGGTVSSNTGATDSPANSRIRSGTNSFQVNNETATLNFSNITIPTGYTSVKVTVYVSSTSVTTNNGADAADSIKITTALNGSTFPTTPDITLNGNSNSRYDFNDTDGADSTSSGTPITIATAGGATNTAPKRSILIVTIPDGTSSVALRIVAMNNDANEIWNIDDVTLDGLAPTAAGAMINGRITDSRGRGLQRVVVMMTGSGIEEPIYATTSAFGYYRFEDVPAGNTYILTASSIRYTFEQPTIVINVNGDLDGADFVGQRRFSGLTDVRKEAKP